MRGLRTYGDVLRLPDVAAALVASLVGRMSMAMNGLALLLLTKEVTGSYAVAGLVAGANGVAFAVVAPRWARAADRRGPSQVLAVSAAVHPATLVLFVLLAAADVPAVVLVACAVLIGATDPPLGSVMRAGWVRVVDAPLLRTAYSIESVSVELCFITGPLLVAGLSALVHPGLAVLASALFSGLGTWRLGRVSFVRSLEGHEERRPRAGGPLSSPQVRLLLLMFACVGFGFGASEVAVIAFVEESGHPRSVGGVVLALWSAGSMVGGLVYGGMHLHAHPARQLPVLAALLACAAALPVTAGSVTALALLMAVYGLGIAPFFACQSLVMGDAAPEGTVTEAFAWTSSMIFAGAAGGTALAGLVVEAEGAGTGLLLTAGSGALLALVVLSGLRTLRRVAATAAPAPSSG